MGTYSESIEPMRPKMQLQLDNNADMFLSKLEQELGTSSKKAAAAEPYDESTQSQMEQTETQMTDPSIQKLTTCPKGHGLVRRTAKEAGTSCCALCGPTPVPKFTRLYSCHACSYDLCSLHGGPQQ